MVRVVSAYDDEIAAGRAPLEAIETLHRGAAYDFDPEVVTMLRRASSGAERSPLKSAPSPGRRYPRPSDFEEAVLRYDVDSPRVTITIDDPERRNPLSNAAMSELANLVRRASVDAAVRVIVITGAGDKAFSAGGDLSGGFVDKPLADHQERGALADLLKALRGCGKPTVARVRACPSGRIRVGGGVRCRSRRRRRHLWRP